VELQRRQIGKTELRVSSLGLGTAPLGEPFVKIEEDEARRLVAAALDAGVTLVDTAPFYGLGLSEHRVGAALRHRAQDEVVLATKVGRLLSPVPRRATRADTSWHGGLRFNATFDYGYDAVMRSHEDSLQRLGLAWVDMLAIHDLDRAFFDARELDRRLNELSKGGARALDDLRRDGVIRAVGLGINELGTVPRVLDLVDLDYVIIAMPYTLVDQPALDAELALCQEHGVSVIIGAPFASGILARDDDEGTYRYEPPPDAIRERVTRLRAVCTRHGISLRSAALQFPLGHPAVASVIPGAESVRQVEQNCKDFSVDIPRDLWVELKVEGLVRMDAPVPT
jgi:D-threo-aldose 1-dehydrogenase